MGVLKNDVGRPTNKTIKIRFILKLIVLILIIGISFFLGYKLTSTKEESKKEEITTTKKEETTTTKKEESTTKEQDKNIINIYAHKEKSSEYVSEHLLIRDYKTKKEEEGFYDYKLIDTYKCKNNSCVLKEQKSYDLETVIIKDGDYISYNFKTKKSNILDIGSTNIDYIINEKYSCDVPGSVCVSSTKINGKTFYEISLISEDNALLGLIGPNYKPIFLVSNKDFNSDDKWNKVYYGLIKADNGNLLYYNKDTFFKYDINTSKVTNSKKYKNIVNITNGYVTVVDNNNNLKILDYSEKEKANLVKITDDMYVHNLLSGWYSENKKEGIYIVVEDKNVKYEDLSKKLQDELGGYTGYDYGYEYYYIPKTGETGKIATYIGGYAKPILYLYPKKDNTKVTVDFAKEDILVTTYPKFKNSWKVTANKNGDLYDSNGKYYYGLYWDEKGSIKVDFKEGFYVTKENAIEFLENKLSVIGLNERERNEFIMYWLPILERNEKNLVYFELTESREAFNKLIINPKPDSLLRVAIHIKKVDKKVAIKEQKLKSFKRKGFTAIEWGGVIH